jgi:1,4-alpha-glucan branching enzyme
VLLAARVVHREPAFVLQPPAGAVRRRPLGKDRDMVSNGTKTGTVQFACKAPDGAAQVCLAGSFNKWTPAPMRKQKDGFFAATLILPAGLYEYKFVIDGTWITDPDHGERATNPFGTMNSVLVVHGTPASAAARQAR